MKVTPTGDGRSFDVTSTDDKDHYVVDIMENEGRGVCSCTDHRCRCQPKLNRGDKAITYSNTHTRTQCKHIDKLIKFFGLTVLRTLDTDTIESLIEIHGDINRVVEHLGITVWCRLNNKQPTDLFEL
jgi:hypothetical protein